MLLVALNALHWALLKKEDVPVRSLARLGKEEEGISSVEDLETWLDTLDLPHHLLSQPFACTGSLPECLTVLSALSSSSELSEVQRSRLEEVSGVVGRKLAMEKWLKDNGWQGMGEDLRKIGVRSLGDLRHFRYEELEVELGWKLLKDVKAAQRYLPEEEEGVRKLEDLILMQIQEQSVRRHREMPENENIGGESLMPKLLALGASFFVCWLVWDLGLTPTEVLWGAPLHKSFTRLSWPSDMTASHSKTLSVFLYDVRGRPVDVSFTSNSLQADAWHQHRRVNARVDHNPAEASSSNSNSNSVQVTFAAKDAGRYYVTLKCDGIMLRGFPAHAYVEPGPPDPK